MAWRLVLASTSPRRREILSNLGLSFHVEPPAVDELAAGEPAARGFSPAELALENARRKALDVLSRKSRPGLRDPVRFAILGVDTIVVRDKIVLSKPSDIADARKMLESLRGRKHEVLSGICLVTDEGAEVSRVVETRVDFAPMSDHEVGWYLGTGEYLDKAGGYGIQGLASVFVDGVEGCYFNVVGLPVRALYEALAELRIPFDELLAPLGGRGR